MNRLSILATGLAVATMSALFAAPAYAASPRVDLKALVFDDGSAGVGVITAQFDREGVPYDRIALVAARPPLTASMLHDTVSGRPRAKYNGVVVPNEFALPANEMTILGSFEAAFGVRQIDAYTAPSASVGLTTVWSGPLDGASMTVTAAGRAAGFGYLNGPLSIADISSDVIESYGYAGAPLPGVNYSSLVTLPQGSLMGVYAHDGREELVVTLAANQYQTHAQELGHGLVTWLTKGVHLGHWRNFFSVHVDDVFLTDDRWNAVGNCTVDDGCPPEHNNLPPIRMTASDVDALVAWQNQQGMKLELAFNGEGAGTDPLTTKLIASRSQFRWLNHTFTHPHLGCVQDFTVVPWRCATDATGKVVYISQAVIRDEISRNISFARGKGISFNAAELVTGEHSGLKSLPQMPVDNPNLAPALSALNITSIAADNSRETAPRKIGSATTTPRHPMGIYYNVSTRADEVDEYNWIYNSAADGGSGVCENNPASTCIPPLDPATGFTSYIVPVETRIAYGHVVSADPRPHYAHQSNLADDRILYPVLDSVLARYRATFSAQTPVVTPRQSEATGHLARQAAWRNAMSNVEAYIQDGRVTIINRSSMSAIPITLPTGTRTITLSLLGIEILGGLYGDVYGPERSDWTGGYVQLMRVPS